MKKGSISAMSISAEVKTEGNPHILLTNSYRWIAFPFVRRSAPGASIVISRGRAKNLTMPVTEFGEVQNRVTSWEERRTGTDTVQTETVDVNDAQIRLKDLVHRVACGGHVILSENRKPVAEIVPLKGRTAGLHVGMIQTSDDFDAPLPDGFWSSEK